MNQTKLKTLFSLQRELEQIKYPDSYIIAKEITQYLENFTQRDQDDLLSSIISDLKNNKPWEYIRGTAEFKGHIFKVNPSTLIPRIETEQLVDMVLNNVTSETKYIVDVCSGTGCILISIVLELLKLEETHQLERTKFIAIEKDEKTIEVLKENIKLHRLESFIEVIESDLFDNYTYELNSTIIVSNPPYISLKDYKALDKSVLDYEPKLALLGGEKGYEITERLLKQLLQRSSSEKSNIDILLETSPEIIHYLEKLSKQQFPQYRVKVVKDIYDLSRFITVQN